MSIRGDALLARITYLERILGLQGPLSTAFFVVSDTKSVQRIRVGFLPNGDYGVWFSDPIGNTQELFPLYTKTTAFVQTASGGGLFTGGPVITAFIGPSGKALVRLTGQTSMGYPSTTQIAVDGISLGAVNGPYINDTGGPFVGALPYQTGEQVITGMTEGDHTFQLYGATSPGFFVGFTGTIMVQPL